MQSTFHKRPQLFAFITGGLFLLLYLILSFHSRLASDDFFYLGLEHDYGAWRGMMYQYENWSGRWAAHFVACGLLQFSKNILFLPLINIFTLVSLVLSLRYLFEKIFSTINLSLNRQQPIVLSIIFSAAFFFSSFSIGESWFWYIIIITYMWSLIAILAILNCIYSRAGKIQNILMIIFCSAFIGGASESFALIFLFVLFSLFIYTYKSKSQSEIKSRIIIAAASILVSFAFAYLAPGTEIRHSLLPHTSIIEKMAVALKSYVKYFIFYLPSKALYLFLLSLPWIYFGNNFLKDQFTKTEIDKFLKSATILFLLSTGAFYLPTVYIMSGAGPDRALLIISFITTIYFSVLFCLLGTRIDLNNPTTRKIFSLLSYVAMAVLMFHIINQYSITREFADAYDSRMKTIQTAAESKRDAVLELDALPACGMLYWEELSADTNYFTNKHLKAGLNLPFAVKLKM